MLVAQRVIRKQAASNRIDCLRSKRMICNLQGEVNKGGTQLIHCNGAKNTRYNHLTQAPGAAFDQPHAYSRATEWQFEYQEKVIRPKQIFPFRPQSTYP
jgi:hypothetical protein